MNLKSIWATLFILYTTLLQAETDIELAIKNNSNSNITYQIDNFKYVDSEATWKYLPARTCVREVIPYCTKFGFYQLKLKDAKGSVFGSYRPSGKTPQVTLIIGEDVKAGKLKITHKIKGLY